MHFFGETETREMKIKEGKKREDVRGGKGNLGKRGEIQRRKKAPSSPVMNRRDAQPASGREWNQVETSGTLELKTWNTLRAKGGK